MYSAWCGGHEGIFTCFLLVNRKYYRYNVRWVLLYAIRFTLYVEEYHIWNFQTLKAQYWEKVTDKLIPGCAKTSARNCPGVMGRMLSSRHPWNSLSQVLCLVSGAVWLLIGSFISSWVGTCISGSSSTLRSGVFLMGLSSVPLPLLILMLLTVSYFFPFLNCRIESKDCIQVSRLELVDHFRWIQIKRPMNSNVRRFYKR